MANPQLNYYEVLGLNQSATSEEIRRAYRILARRYHPDLNPGKSSEERFKIISLAYQTLSDPEKKRAYDGEVDSDRKIRAGFAAYERAKNYSRPSSYTRHNASNQPKNKQSTHNSRPSVPLQNTSSLSDNLIAGASKIRSLFSRKNKKVPHKAQDIVASKLSVIEVSITMQDALFGGRKSIEIPGEPKNKKISLRVPSGVRTGSVLRLRTGTHNAEDYVIILRVAPHPLLELQPKGVLIDIPITISEALLGASIKVPGLEVEETITIPAGSQSGQEIRLSGKGVKHDDGRVGDIFYRLNIQIPISTQAPGLKEKVAAVSEYYESPLRQGLFRNLKS